MIKSSLNLNLRPGLSMTPALQQAIRLLQLSHLDLKQEIQSMLDSNLMLELADDNVTWDVDQSNHDTADAAATDIPDELPIDADWGNLYDDQPKLGNDSQDAFDNRNANLHTESDLRTHLLWQVETGPFSPPELLIATYLVDAINDQGYIEHWPSLRSSIVEQTGATDTLVDDVLDRVQRFDPPGVGARSLQECLTIQLQQLAELTRNKESSQNIKIASRFVTDHFDRLAKPNFEQLALRLECDERRVRSALSLIQSLQPHPGATFANIDEHYVTPDIVIKKHEGQWIASLNPELSPKLRINSTYLNFIRRGDKSDDQQTMKQHLQEARYFIGALQNRHDTLLRVAGCILDEQRAFFDHGEEAMRPLILRDVATRIGVHESTVSRATTQKYMHTPRGLFELKYFFSSHVRTAEGGACSATAIQAMIRRLINDETSGRPLSDSALTRALNEQGIDVARRTVAKYREGLGIPPSHERRRQAKTNRGGQYSPVN